MSSRIGFRTARLTIPVAIVACASIVTAVVGDADAKSFKVSTDRRGQLVVVDEGSGKVVHRIAKPPGVVREVFVLDQGTTVATTKKDLTEFWDASTGRLKGRLDERIYAFSHDLRSFATYTSTRDLIVRAYPDRSVRHLLAPKSSGGPSGLAFSPDDRYLAVEFCNVYPLTDEQFLNPSFLKTYYWVKVYDLTTGEAIPELGGGSLGKFTADSRYYVTDGPKFDLAARKFTSSGER